jgi:hypothetical protein
MTLALTRRTVTVTLGPAHVAQAEVQVKRRHGTLRFAVPGLPKAIVFALKAKGTKLDGTASEGAVRATVTLTRGRRSIDTTLGYFTSPNVEVARFTRHGFSTKPFVIDLATGAFGPPPAQVGTRLDVHQFEVRFPSGKAMLAGTLTVPPGTEPHPAVVYVSGSGDTLREESHWLDGLVVSRGIARAGP